MTCPDWPKCQGSTPNHYSPRLKGELRATVLRGKYGAVCQTLIAGSDNYPHLLNLWVPSECGWYRPEFGEWTRIGGENNE